MELEQQQWLYDKPWLILGKGPSLEFFFSDEFDGSKYHILALNHVGLIVGATITLFIDMDVWNEKFLMTSRYILAPFHPHINFRPAVGLLKELLPISDGVNKVYQFSLSTYKKKQPSPVIQTKFNCAEAAFQILGHLGIHEVYSLGVDGGTKYARQFSKLTPLQNRQPNFDRQFKEIEKTCQEFGIDWTRL